MCILEIAHPANTESKVQKLSRLLPLSLAAILSEEELTHILRVAVAGIYIWDNVAGCTVADFTGVSARLRQEGIKISLVLSIIDNGVGTRLKEVLFVRS